MSQVQRSSHRWAVLTALLVTVLWSVSWVLIREGLDEEALSPIGFAALRYGLAAIVLAGWALSRPAARRAVKSMGRASWTGVIVLGVVFYAVTQGAQFVAIDNQPAATTSLLLAMTPLFVAIASARSLAEAPVPRQWLGAGLVAGGAWLYFSGDLGATVVGMVAAIVGLLANTSGSIIGRYVNRAGDLSALVVTALSMAVGGLVLVVVAVSSEGVPAPTPRGWLIIVWLAVVHTAVAFTLWNFSLRRLTAIESSAINSTMLVQIALLAWWFLDEPPGVGGLGGVVLVSIGVFLTQAAGASRNAVRASSILNRSGARQDSRLVDPPPGRAGKKKPDNRPGN